MKRTEYYRAYYGRTVDRRRLLARQHKLQRRWATWLLLEIGISPAVVFSKPERKPH